MIAVPKKTKKMLAIEAQRGRPFWQVVDSLARKGHSRAEAAEILGYGDAHFRRMLKAHADPIEWRPSQHTRRAQAARKARRGTCSPKVRAKLQQARASRREGCLYDLHGFVGTVSDHAARQGIPKSTVATRRRDGWSLSEALGYVERAASHKGYAVRRIEREHGKPFLDVLRGLAGQGMSTHRAASVLQMHHCSVMYHVEKAGGIEALGFKAYAQPKGIDRSAQQASWLRTKGRMITHDGRTQHLNAWAAETGLNATTIGHRLNHLGWSEHDALTIPARGRRKSESRA